MAETPAAPSRNTSSEGEPSLAHDTRHRLLEVALNAFGQRDYDGVSVREIAEAAGANVSAVSYHFGGKKGLYLATAEYLAQVHREAFRSLFEQAEAQAQGASSDECRAIIGQAMGIMVEHMILSFPDSKGPGLIFREQMQPTEAFDILYESLFSHMHNLLARLVARIHGISPTSSQARFASHTLLGQVLVYRFTQPTLLRHLGQKEFGSNDIAEIKNTVAVMVEAALDCTLNCDGVSKGTGS